MGIFKYLSAYSKDFIRKLGFFVSLFLISNIFVGIVAWLLNWGTQLLITAGNIQYISYTNIEVIFSKPFIVLGLIVELLIILLAVYWQLAFLFLGFQQLNITNRLNLRIVTRQMMQLTRNNFFKSIGFFLLYFTLVIPFGGVIFQSGLLRKAIIPTFIEEFLFNNPLYAILLTIFYLVITYLSVRLLFVLPLTILGDYSLSNAISQSRKITKDKFWYYVIRSIIITLVTMLVAYALYGIIFAEQRYFDGFKNQVALIAGIMNLSLVELIGWFISIWSGVLLLQLIMTNEAIISLPISKIDQYSFGDFVRSKKIYRRLLTVIMITIALLYLLLNGLYLSGLATTRPVSISHRGVDNGNGVQNTISAMAKTTLEHPDYIEIDVQETKDHQFVVMHDENLSKLAGVNKAPQDLTLEQLQAITVHENGYSDKIASFDDYLKYANQHKQKLLIEIKTTPNDSSQLMKNFVHKYENIILRNHDQVQSLDFKVISYLKKNISSIKTYYILPYNLTFAHTNANGYTMEETTLNDNYVNRAHFNGQKVYSWTVNDTEDMMKAMFMDVDGIITDNLHDLKQETKSFEDDPDYSIKIWNYVMGNQVDFEGTI